MNKVNDDIKNYIKIILIICLSALVLIVLEWGLLDYQNITNLPQGTAIRSLVENQKPLIMKHSALIKIVLGVLAFFLIAEVRQDCFHISPSYAIIILIVFFIIIVSTIVSLSMMMVGGVPLVPLFFIMSTSTSTGLYMYIGIIFMNFLFGNTTIGLNKKQKIKKAALSFVIIFVGSAFAWYGKTIIQNHFPSAYMGLIFSVIYVVLGAIDGLALVWIMVPFKKENYNFQLTYVLIGSGFLLLEMVLLILFGSGLVSYNMFSLFLFQEMTIVSLSALFAIILIRGFYGIKR
ncbi:hypothetical protein [Eubacterium limosum]|uniref:hypothetical protein n=1 Tax=Eubacterium limosum TaxID=1736 RepID=UPI0022DED8D5|nr:hypothetical protein [Eubacterium limosum]